MAQSEWKKNIGKENILENGKKREKWKKWEESKLKRGSERQMEQLITVIHILYFRTFLVDYFVMVFRNTILGVSIQFPLSYFGVLYGQRKHVRQLQAFFFM